jgi:hypothetical protein
VLGVGVVLRVVRVVAPGVGFCVEPDWGVVAPGLVVVPPCGAAVPLPAVCAAAQLPQASIVANSIVLNFI